MAVSFTNPLDPRKPTPPAGFHYALRLRRQFTRRCRRCTRRRARPQHHACSYNTNGTFTVVGRIFDKDSNYTDYSASTTITAYADLEITVDDGQTTAVIGSVVTLHHCRHEPRPGLRDRLWRWWAMFPAALTGA